MTDPDRIAGTPGGGDIDRHAGNATLRAGAREPRGTARSSDSAIRGGGDMMFVRVRID